MKFGKYHLGPGKGGKGLRTGEAPGPRPRLQYGGAQENLDAQAIVISDCNREKDLTGWVLHQKIYIVGVLVDMTEAECPWSTENRDNILWFKKNIGKDREFMNRWRETLEGLLGQQDISLEQLMSAEMLNERGKHEQKAELAKIMRKPTAEITAEELKLIEGRMAARSNRSSSSSHPNLGKGANVEDETNKGTPKAAPAVVRKTPKAPPEQPPNILPAPRRPAPPIDPPEPLAKRAKGASKGAAERAASGSKEAFKGAAVRAESGSRSGNGVGKGKGSWGGKGKPKGGPPDWYCPPGRDNFDHCLLLLLPSSEMLRIADLMGKKESLFEGMLSRMSLRLIGEGANARLSCNSGPQHVIRPTLRFVSGMNTLGLVGILLLLRKTAITGEMQAIRRNSAVAMTGGIRPLILRQT